MKNLSVEFCGRTLINPFLVAPSPFSDSRDKAELVLQEEFAGVVMKTVTVKEKIQALAEPNIGTIRGENAGSFSLYNYDLISERPVEEVCEDIAYLKKKYPDQILIGSIMGYEEADWDYLIQCMEDAHADMIEVSMSCPQGDREGKIAAADPEVLRQTLKSIKKKMRTNTPIIVKLTPNVTDIGLIAAAAEEGGADCLCAIDTVRAFIGLDIETGIPKLNVNGFSTFGGLSGSIIKPIALGCAAMISQKTSIPFIGIGGISDYKDTLEFIMLGASAVEICTAITNHGLKIIHTLCRELSEYMERKGIENLSGLKGSSMKYLVAQEGLSRTYKASVSVDRTLCRKCGRCIRACHEGGFNAMKESTDGYPYPDGGCRRCGICSSICNVNAIRIK